MAQQKTVAVPVVVHASQSRFAWTETTPALYNNDVTDYAGYLLENTRIPCPAVIPFTGTAGSLTTDITGINFGDVGGVQLVALKITLSELATSPINSVTISAEYLAPAGLGTIICSPITVRGTRREALAGSSFCFYVVLGAMQMGYDISSSPPTQKQIGSVWMAGPLPLPLSPTAPSPSGPFVRVTVSTAGGVGSLKTVTPVFLGHKGEFENFLRVLEETTADVQG